MRTEKHKGKDFKYNKKQPLIKIHTCTFAGEVVRLYHIPFNTSTLMHVSGRHTFLGAGAPLVTGVKV